MSYAGPSRGSGSARTARSSRAASSAVRPTPTRGTNPAASSNGLETDWGQVALFGAGLALGITLGAGAALLTAPRTGEETRAVLRGRVGRFRRTAGRKSHDVWDDLRDELAGVKHAIRRRKLKRAAERNRRRELDLEAALE
jgi:gas vesicle protein